jgi:hypothetical protein
LYDLFILTYQVSQKELENEEVLKKVKELRQQKDIDLAQSCNQSLAKNLIRELNELS